MYETLETKFKNPTNSVEKQIVKLNPWFHNIHLPGGVQTAPDHKLGDFPACNWRRIEPFLPPDISKMTVLDIGCNAGFYSFELARLGAQVTAFDSDVHYLKQARWAAGKMHLNINFKCMQIYDLISTTQKYDIVLFMGVLYHLRHPLLALELVASLVKKYMFFQTMILPGDEKMETPYDLDFDKRSALNQSGWPKMAFVEKRLAGDPTNWWVPNAACVEAMLRSSGFTILKHITREFYLCAPRRVPILNSKPKALGKWIVQNKFNPYC